MAIGIASLKLRTVQVGAAAFAFAAGEVIFTQYAYKATMKELAAAAGVDPQQVWTDAGSMFAIHFLAA